MSPETPRKRRIPWSRLALGAVGVAVVLGLVWAWMPQPVQVVTTPVSRGDVVVEIVEDGQARVVDRYVVSAPLAGTLARIELEPGDAVEAGQGVAWLMPTESPLLDARTRAEATVAVAAAKDARRVARAALEAAEVAAVEAERERDRVRAMGDFVSVQDRDRAEAQARVLREQSTSARFALEVAEHEVEMAASVLDRAGGGHAGETFQVTAPAGGRVLRVFQESAGVVAPGTPLLEVGDPRALEVVVDVLSTDAVRVTPMAPVRVERWGGTSSLSGRVRRVEPAAFTRLSALGVEEQRVNVVVDLDGPVEAWGTLGDGYRVEARIEVARAEGVVVVPEAAVFRSRGEPAVFVDADGRASQRIVRLGLSDGVTAEVLDGLAEGERVVLHPSESVREGVRLRAL